MLVCGCKHFCVSSILTCGHTQKKGSREPQQNTCPQPDPLLVDSSKRAWQPAYKQRRTSSAFSVFSAPASKLPGAFLLLVGVRLCDFLFPLWNINHNYACERCVRGVGSSRWLSDLSQWLLPFTSFSRVRLVSASTDEAQHADAELLHFTAVMFSSGAQSVSTVIDKRLMCSSFWIKFLWDDQTGSVPTYLPTALLYLSV